MFDKSAFTFDPEKIAEMFSANEFTKYLSDAKLPAVDPEALMAAQKKNMEALVEANKAAAAGYQDLFKKQVSIFEDTMAEAKSQLTEFDASKMSPEAASAQAEIAKAAFEKAIANMTDLAETAKKANTDAYEIVSARIKASVEELKELAEGLSK